VVLILLTGAWFLARQKNQSIETLSFSIALIIMLMLLLSPTLYPWYYISLIALAALIPHPIFLLWTLLLPLSYLKWLCPGLMPWIIHVPIWCLLIWLGFKKFRTQKESTHA
jgi:hypothetical protein